MWFRAICTLGFCLSALAIVYSAIIIRSLSTYEPDRAKHVRIPVVRAISRWSQIGICMLVLSIIVTLVAAAIKPIADITAHASAHSCDTSSCTVCTNDRLGLACFKIVAVLLTLAIMLITAGITVSAFFGMCGGKIGLYCLNRLPSDLCKATDSIVAGSGGKYPYSVYDCDGKGIDDACIEIAETKARAEREIAANAAMRQAHNVPGSCKAAIRSAALLADGIQAPAESKPSTWKCDSCIVPCAYRDTGFSFSHAEHSYRGPG